MAAGLFEGIGQDRQGVEPVLFDPEPWVTYRVTEEAVRGGPIEKLDFLGLTSSPVKQSSLAAPLRHRMGRRLADG